MQESIKKVIMSMSDELCRMSDTIYDYNEISTKEYRSCRLLEDYLESNGFVVERKIGGMDTAFRAVYENGEGGPSFGLLAEYDALEIQGHGCAHHMQGPSIIGAAMAIKEICKDSPYKIVVYGTPAEETLGGKIIMQENGCFQDIDIALMMHGASSTGVDIKCMALENFVVTFKGSSAHAAMNPEEGRSAFDAALLSFQGIEFMREHVLEDTRMHYTIRNAGGAPNVVPDTAVAEYTLRSYSSDYLNTIVKRFYNVIKGACLMTDTSYEIHRDPAFMSKIPSYTLNDIAMEQAEIFSAPQISEPRKKTGSTDFGNVMYYVPGTCIRIAFVDEGTPAHSEGYVKAGKTERAHNALLIASQILAGTCIELLNNKEKLEAVKQEFVINKSKYR